VTAACVAFCGAAFITTFVGSTSAVSLSAAPTTMVPTVAAPAVLHSRPMLGARHTRIQRGTELQAGLPDSDAIATSAVEYVAAAEPSGVQAPLFLAAALSAAAAVWFGVRGPRQQGPLDPMDISSLPVHRVSMAAMFGGKKDEQQAPPNNAGAPGGPGMPSLADAMQAVERMGGAQALQKAVSTLPPEMMMKMAEISRQTMTQGPQSLTPEQQNIMINIQMQIFTNLKADGVQFDPQIEAMITAVEQRQAQMAGDAAPPPAAAPAAAPAENNDEPDWGNFGAKK